MGYSPMRALVTRGRNSKEQEINYLNSVEHIMQDKVPLQLNSKAPDQFSIKERFKVCTWKEGRKVRERKKERKKESLRTLYGPDDRTEM
jgi:hypothetical protein